MVNPSLRPVRWQPPTNQRPVTRRTTVRTLPRLTLIPLPGEGPEHVAVDGEGRLVTGLADGRVLRVTADGKHTEVLAETGGRPLGVEVLGDGALVVCDAQKGLLRVDPSDGKIDVLCDRVAGEPLILCSNAAPAADGSIFFTQSSQRFGLDRYKGDLLEHSGTGRLLRYDGRDGSVTVLSEGLHFANGVVLSPGADGSGDSVIVAETGGYQLTRHWLTGDLAGTDEVFAATPAGFPDNLTTGPTGLVWAAMVSPRDPLLDWLHPRGPGLRNAVWALPDRLQPGPRDVAWLTAFGPDGAVVHDLCGWGAGYRAVTAAREHEGKVYLGSLTERAIAVFDLSPRGSLMSMHHENTTDETHVSTTAENRS